MKRNEPNIRSFTRQFYRGNMVCFLFSLCGTLLMTIASLLVSWLLQQILDLIGGYDSRFTLTELAAAALILIFLITAAQIISCYSCPAFITRGMLQYKEYIFERLIQKNISAFSRENSSAYLSALTNDVQAIEQGYLKNLFSLLEGLLTFFGAAALMLWYSPLLTLAAAGLTLFPLLASVLTGNRLARAEKKISDQNQICTSALKDSLEGFSVIKSFKAETRIFHLFRDNLLKLAEAQCSRQKTQILVETCASVAGIAAQLGVFLLGACLSLSDSSVSPGTTLIFVQLMSYILSPIQTIPAYLAERKAAKTLVRKISDLLNTNVHVPPETAPLSLNQGISIRNLTFGYEPEKQILRDISFSFKRGKKYAIVGASGSGKSTFLNLLMGAHQNYDGTIAYDGTELRRISSEHLYETVSLIQQNVFIFNASIRDNITMFADFPEEEVERAINLSGLSGLIAERGESYLCGENGSGLSGGERQRISIARSLLRKSQVLLVDEATSSLDAATAFQISSAVLDMKELTSVMITHGLDKNLLKRYDMILAFKNGAVAESGTFDELMARKGYFYSLYTVSQ